MHILNYSVFSENFRCFTRLADILSSVIRYSTGVVAILRGFSLIGDMWLCYLRYFDYITLLVVGMVMMVVMMVMMMVMMGW